MSKLIFTLLTLTAPPGLAPSATSATSELPFVNSRLCASVLDGMRHQGDHVVLVRGNEVTMHFVGGKCVMDLEEPRDPRDVVQ